MRYDRARKNLDRHVNYILAAFMPPAGNHKNSQAGECSTIQSRSLARSLLPMGECSVGVLMRFAGNVIVGAGPRGVD
jgi:hypothetical protein